MDALAELISNSIVNQMTVPKMLALTIAKKLKKVGFILNRENLSALESQITKQVGDNPKESLDLMRSMPLEFEEEWFSDPKPSEADLRLIHLTLDDMPDFEALISATMETAVPTMVSELGVLLFDAWKSQASECLQNDRSKEAHFAPYITKVWGKPIELLEMLISIIVDESSRFNASNQQEASANNDMVFEALTRLHARGCQVGREVLVLLRNGLADGAHARWRTLHELTVTASFIKEQGNDTALRYLCHADIDIYNEMLRYQAHYTALGGEAIPDKDVQDMESQYKALIDQFGEGFESDYGWASKALGVKRPKLQDIEKTANLDHMRWYVKMASANIHSTSRGTLYPLGMPLFGPDVLIAGPSVFGHSDPGRNMSSSISLLTATLLLSKPTLDNFAFLHAIIDLRKEIHDAFYEAEANLAKEQDKRNQNASRKGRKGKKKPRT